MRVTLTKLPSAAPKDSAGAPSHITGWTIYADGKEVDFKPINEPLPFVVKGDYPFGTAFTVAPTNELGIGPKMPPKELTQPKGKPAKATGDFEIVFDLIASSATPVEVSAPVVNPGDFSWVTGFDLTDTPNIGIPVKGASWQSHYGLTCKRLTDGSDHIAQATTLKGVATIYPKMASISDDGTRIVDALVNGGSGFVHDIDGSFININGAALSGSGGMAGATNSIPEFFPGSRTEFAFARTGGAGDGFLYTADLDAMSSSVLMDVANVVSINGDTNKTNLKTEYPQVNNWGNGNENAFNVPNMRYFAGFLQDTSATPNRIGCYIWDRTTNTIPIARLWGDFTTSDTDIQTAFASNSDSIKVSPSGRHVILINGDASFSFKMSDPDDMYLIHNSGAHSDCFALPNGNDAYIWPQYSSATHHPASADRINYVDLDTRVRTPLLGNQSLYGGLPVPSAIHFCGNAVNKPGYVVGATYNRLDTPEAALQNKVFIIDVINDLIYNVSHAGWNWDGAVVGVKDSLGEPKALCNRDLTKIVWTSYFYPGSSAGDIYDLVIADVPALPDLV